MLSYSQFQSMSQQKQAEVLWMRGVYLELKRISGRFLVELFSLGAFYVELYFNRETEEPEFIRSFQNMGLLDPYLQTVEIDGLFQPE